MVGIDCEDPQHRHGQAVLCMVGKTVLQKATITGSHCQRKQAVGEGRTRGGRWKAELKQWGLARRDSQEGSQIPSNLLGLEANLGAFCLPQGPLSTQNSLCTHKGTGMKDPRHGSRGALPGSLLQALLCFPVTGPSVGQLPKLSHTGLSEAPTLPGASGSHVLPRPASGHLALSI